MIAREYDDEDVSPAVAGVDDDEEADGFYDVEVDEEGPGSASRY